MFTLGTAWWEIILRSSIIYVVIVVALRLTGRRSLGQRNPIDLVLVLIVANAVQNAMIGSDTSLIGGIIAAATLFVMDVALDRILGRSKDARKFFSGSPVILIRHGQLIEQNLAKERISYDELEESLREHGVEQVGDVKLAILEVDGSLSIVPATSEVKQGSRPVRRHRARARINASLQ
jgi:uncharacterized membrane protein YcaP (DUF421 family)